MRSEQKERSAITVAVAIGLLRRRSVPRHTEQVAEVVERSGERMLHCLWGEGVMMEKRVDSRCYIRR